MSVNVTKHGLIMRANNVVKRNPEIRFGQALFNCLYEMDPILAECVRTTSVDPFYCEKGNPRIEKFFTEIFGK